MKRCRKCSSLMPDDAARCIRCGSESSQSTIAPSQKSAVKPVTQVSGQPVTAKTPVIRKGEDTIAPMAWKAGDRPGKLRRGWLLAGQSWRILMLDKELLVFPLFSGLSCFLVLASFAAGLFASGVPERREEAMSEAITWVALFAYYFANYFVIVFFNSALIACVMIRFRGGDPTVADGMRAATERVPQIVAWALLAATVGVILRMLEQRAAFILRIVIALLGAAWTIATYFIVPVLVIEKLGPFDALKRSVSIMKDNWGESLVSNVGISAIATLVGLALIVTIGSATFMLAALTGSLAVVVTGVVLGIVALLLVALVSSALSSIVLGALYLYAAEEKMPAAFEGPWVEEAFAPK